MPSGAKKEGWQYTSLCHRVQTGSRDHPASYLMGNGSSFPRGKGQSGRSVKITTHHQLAPRLRRHELYLHSTMRLRGVVLSTGCLYGVIVKPKDNYTFI